jgi:hypothetical protein
MFTTRRGSDDHASPDLLSYTSPMLPLMDDSRVCTSSPVVAYKTHDCQVRRKL